MQPLTRPNAIIDYCLQPLSLDPASAPAIEVRRRLEHAIKAFQTLAARPVAVDFSTMRSQVINEAAHGYE